MGSVSALAEESRSGESCLWSARDTVQVAKATIYVSCLGSGKTQGLPYLIEFRCRHNEDLRTHRNVAARHPILHDT